ncbi:unnamed protein product [Nezara viridula]|uniref:Neuropeptide n=1 Tax=Nezara viridula TaxID=85310 RepID=A0A9P0H3Z4_NEZVI|nr:unnamed protein product [Nezara viridula]
MNTASVYILLVIRIILVPGSGENVGGEGREEMKAIEKEAEVAATRGPYFDTTFSKNETALVGRNAFLYCRVRNLGNRTVSQLLLFLHAN